MPDQHNFRTAHRACFRGPWSGRGVRWTAKKLRVTLPVRGRAAISAETQSEQRRKRIDRLLRQGYPLGLRTAWVLETPAMQERDRSQAALINEAAKTSPHSPRIPHCLASTGYSPHDTWPNESART
jgi:hypothetical protein